MFPFGIFFFLGLSEVFMIALFGYVLNHLMKNSNVSLIYGSIIVITIYILILNSLFYYPLVPKKFDDVFYFIRKNNNSDTRIIINTILFP